MLHGFPAFWYTWRDQMPALAKQFQVVAIDLRGYNKSDQPQRVENYTMEKLAGDLAAVLQHFKQDKATIVGHDWGGGRLVVFRDDPPREGRTARHSQPAAPKCQSPANLANNPEQQKASQYARDFQKPDAAKKVPAAMLRFGVKEADARKVYAEALGRSSMEGMLNYYKANYFKEPYKDDKTFPPVKCPVLMIHGLKDPYLLPGALNDTWKYVEKDFTLVTVPQAGHFVHRDAPELVTKTMLRCLRRLRGSENRTGGRIVKEWLTATLQRLADGSLLPATYFAELNCDAALDSP